MRHSARTKRNRENAQKSTGPRTEEGKKRSSLNAVRHGITGHILVVPETEMLAYRHHTEKHVKSLEAETDAEITYAQSIADDWWRINRIKAMELHIFAIGHLSELKIDAGAPQINDAISNAQMFLGELPGFKLLSIYENRIHRNIEKQMKQLEALKAERKARQAKELEEAKLLAQLALIEGQTYDPKEDIAIPGFVYSSRELNALIDRDNRLNRARELAKASAASPQKGQLHRVA